MGNQGFQAEFGLDEHGLLPMEICFCLLFSFDFLAISRFAFRRDARLQGNSSDRPLLRLLQASAGLSAVGCGFLSAHHVVFANDGSGLASVGVLGTLVACAAKALLTMLQFFIARGWALV